MNQIDKARFIFDYDAPWLGYGPEGKTVSSGHKQVKVRFTHGLAWVDEGLANVLLAMNAVGAKPLWSCQAQYVSFESEECLRRVLNTWPDLKVFVERFGAHVLRWKPRQLPLIKKVMGF